MSDWIPARCISKREHIFALRSHPTHAGASVHGCGKQLTLLPPLFCSFCCAALLFVSQPICLTVTCLVPSQLAAALQIRLKLRWDAVVQQLTGGSVVTAESQTPPISRH